MNSYGQPGFSNVGVPTYPMLGTTTVYNSGNTTNTTTTSNTTTTDNTEPSTPAPAPVYGNYSAYTLSQQIVSNYNTSLQSQDQSVYNPTNTGYGYNYSSTAITASNYSNYSNNANYGGMVNGYYGQAGPTQLWTQVVNITTGTGNATSGSGGLLALGDTAPEPATMALLASGRATLIVIRRRKLRRQDA